MHDVDEMIERLLDMDIVGEDNSIVFTDEAKQLIHMKMSAKMLIPIISQKLKERGL